jgi:hypothetical protein
LEREVRVYKSTVTEQNADHWDCVIEENEKLQKKVKDMEDLLHTYGFKWLAPMPKVDWPTNLN